MFPLRPLKFISLPFSCFLNISGLTSEVYVLPIRMIVAGCFCAARKHPAQRNLTLFYTMKLHLPLILRSVLLAACAISCTTLSLAEDFIAPKPTDSLIIEDRSGGGPYSASSHITGWETVRFRDNYAELNSDSFYAVGGAISCDDLVVSDCGTVEFTNNYVKNSESAGGGAFSGSSLFRNCETVRFQGNYAEAGTSEFDDVYGGAIYSNGKLVFSNCGTIEFTGNYTQSDKTEDYLPGDVAWGGALYASSSNGSAVVFEANNNVTMRGNYVTEDGRYVLDSFFIDCMGANAQGGRRDAYGLEIKTKADQTFICYDSGWVDGVLYINGDKDYLTRELREEDRFTGTVTFSGEHTEEDLREIIKGRKPSQWEIDASRLINAEYAQVCDGTLELRDGVTLAMVRDDAYMGWGTESENTPGYSMIVAGRAHLVMKDSTIVAQREVYDTSKPWDDGYVTGGEVYISNAEFTGANTIYTHVLEATGGRWTFNVTDANLTEPLVTIMFSNEGKLIYDMEEWTNPSGPGTFTSAEGTVFDIELGQAKLGKGKYKLLEFDKTDGAWDREAGIPEITGKAGSTTIGEAGQGDVYLMTEGNTVTLIFDTAGVSAGPEPNPEPAPEDRQPTTLTWGNGNGTWAENAGDGDGHWSASVEDKNFYKGDSVVFGSAAEVTLQGVLRPGNVLVNNADGTVKFTGSGQITDVDIPSRQVKLTKEGAGTLEIDTNNAYTGGTELKAGTLVAGNAGALGLGAVRVSGGTLDMRGNALTNELDVAGTANVANAGKYAGRLVLESGVLNGDLNLEQDADLKGGTVAGALSGKGGVAVSGDATLSGANTYTGKTTVQGGGNLHVTGSLTSKELEVQSGGTYSGAISGTGLNVNLAGGAIAGDVTLGEGSTLRATAQGAAVKGKLSVASGGSLSVKDVQEGATLSVGELVADGGKLALDPAKPGALDVGTFTTTANRTALDTGDDVLYREAGEYTLLNYKNLGSGSSVDALYLMASEGLHSRKEFKLDLRATSLTLSISGETQSLTWQGNTGVWTNEAGHEWQTNAGVADKNFYDLDAVKFVDAGDVKIQGNVMPGSVEVEVSEGKTTTFTNVDDKTLGHIRGSAPLTKDGKGTLAIETDNSGYTGDITVKAGTLKAGHTNAFGSGNVYVNGATFDADSLNVAAKVTMRGESVLENASNMKALTFDSGARVKSSTGHTLASGNTLTIGPTGSASYTGDFTFAGGTLALTGGVFDLSGAKVTFSEGTRSVLDLSGWEGLTYGQEYTVLTGDIATDMLDVRLGNGMDGAAHLEERDGKVVLVIDGVTGAPQSGAEYATAISSQTEGNMAHLRRLRGAIGSGQALSSDRKVGAYITGYTEDNRLEQDAQGLGYHRTEIGGTLGVETARKDGKLVVGAALSAGRAHVSPTGPAPRYHVDIIREDLYLVANLGRLRSTTTVGLGQHEIDMRRAGASSQDVSGNSVNLSEELAVTLNRSEKHSFESFFAVESSYNRIDGFSEGGANPAALNVDAHEAFATDLSLGLRANFLFPMVSGAPSAVFSVQGAAITSVGDTVTDVTMRYAGAPDSSYSVRSAKRNRWGYSAGASLTVPVTPNAAIFGSSEAVLRGDSHEVTATVGVKLTF